MSLSVKFSDIIQVFSGDGDFSEWLRKLKLVAKLQKVKDLVAFLPLFLSGGAFAVYEGLDEAIRNSEEELEKALTAAFSPNKYDAYEQFVNRRLRPNESVDVFVADIKRLAALVGPGVPDEMLQCAMLRGLPERMRCQLMASCKLNTMTFAEIVERSRLLQTPADAVAEFGMAAVQQWEERRRCFGCKESGHLSRQCPNKGSWEEKRKCHLCGVEGHLMAWCPKRESTPKNE